MNDTTTFGASPLAAALNDRSRTRIGNPRRGTFHLSIAVHDTTEATELGKQLDLVGATYQANFKRNSDGTPTMAFLAIYSLGDQQRLLGALQASLDPDARHALETLVAARGPIPDEIVHRIRDYRSMGKDPGWIATRMNEAGIVDGMGRRGWTAAKVTRAERGEIPARLLEREAA